MQKYWIFQLSLFSFIFISFSLFAQTVNEFMKEQLKTSDSQLPHLFRQGDDHRSAFSFFAFNPDCAMIGFHNPFAN